MLLNHAISLQRQYAGGSGSSILIESLFVVLTAALSTTEDVIQSCKDLISSHFFAIDGLPTIVALHKDDHEGHLILRCAAIVAHSAMAILLRTLSQALSTAQSHSAFSGDEHTPPVVYRRRCRKSLKEAIKITRGLADSDFPFIDVAMAVRSPYRRRLLCVPLIARLSLGSAGMLVPDPVAHRRIRPGRRNYRGQS